VIHSPEKPQIGFDRFIQLEWAESAFRTRAGLTDSQQLLDLLEESHPGAAARKKTRTVLNRLWLEPRADLVDFADRAVSIYLETPDTPIAALTWGMAIATYPFFGSVAQIVGRLTALQGDCASAEVHRRMAEVYGEREGTRRMTNMVLQSQASWGAIDRIARGKRLARKEKIAVRESAATSWLVEACLRYAGHPLSIAGLDTSPVIYPFELGSSLSYLLSTVPPLEVRTDGTGNQVVGLDG
jgi:hypothetical protein